MQALYFSTISLFVLCNLIFFLYLTCSAMKRASFVVHSNVSPRIGLKGFSVRSALLYGTMAKIVAYAKRIVASLSYSQQKKKKLYNTPFKSNLSFKKM